MEFDFLERIKKQIEKRQVLTTLIALFTIFYALLGFIDTVQVLGDLPDWLLIAIGVLAFAAILGIAIMIASDDRSYYSFTWRLFARIISFLLIVLLLIFGWPKIEERIQIPSQLLQLKEIVFAVVVLLTLIWLIWATLKDNRKSSAIRILVCEFGEGAREEIPDDRTITQMVLERLREKAETENTKIIHHDKVILETNEALALGQKAGAAAVLFGFYTKYPNSVFLNLRFQVIRKPELSVPDASLQDSLPFEDLERGELQLYLGRNYSSVALFFAGLFKYTEENFEQALSLFQDALGEIDSEDHDSRYSIPIDSIYLYMGNCQRYQGNEQEAVNSIEQALAYNSDNCKALHNLAVLHFGKDEYNQALEYFDRAIACDPNLFLAYRNRAFANFAANKPEEAVDDLENYLSEISDDLPAIELLAICYENLEEYEIAAEKYGTILAVDPSFHRVRFSMARSYLKIDKDEIAINLLEPLASNKDYALDVYDLLGSSFFENGKFTESIDYLSEALHLSPAEDRQLLFLRARAYLKNDQYNESLKDLDRILLDRPDLQNALYYRGKVKAEQGDYSGAAIDFTNFINLADKSNVHLGYASRAMNSLKQNRFCEAVPDFELAINTSPTNGTKQKYSKALAVAHYSCAHLLAANEEDPFKISLHLQEIKILDSEMWAEKVQTKDLFQEALAA